MIKRYAKRREPIVAAQWTGEMTPEVTAVLGPRAVRSSVGSDRSLEFAGSRGPGRFAQVGDWIYSTSGEDLSVIGDEQFRAIYEEIDDPGTSTAGHEFVRALDLLLAAGRKLPREQYPVVFRSGDALLWAVGFQIDHVKRELLDAIAKELSPVGEHPLNQAIDRTVAAGAASPPCDLLARVRALCAEVPRAHLLVATEVHRANCREPSCPVLAAMAAIAEARDGSEAP